MPEVERPEALQGCKANRAFISQECGAEQGIVRFWEGGVYVPDGKSRGRG